MLVKKRSLIKYIAKIFTFGKGKATPAEVFLWIFHYWVPDLRSLWVAFQLLASAPSSGEKISPECSLENG